jgi:hypothetical protein
MQLIIEYIFRALFLLSVALTFGCVLLIGFVRACLFLGLINEQEKGNSLTEFLQGFS